jgi:hypothetical protein
MVTGSDSLRLYKGRVTLFHAPDDSDDDDSDDADAEGAAEADEDEDAADDGADSKKTDAQVYIYIIPIHATYIHTFKPHRIESRVS